MFLIGRSSTWWRRRGIGYIAVCLNNHQPTKYDLLCLPQESEVSTRKKYHNSGTAIYEQVDELQYSKEAAVAIKQNEAYGQISSQTTPNPPCTTGV